MPILSVASFKGGTAKTSVTLHLGDALRRFHQKTVLLVDFDAQANLTTGLGFDPDEQTSLAPVLQGEAVIDDIILKTEFPGLDLIPADTYLERIEVTGKLAHDRYSHEKLKQLLRPLNYDYIILDTPPSLCWLTESALIASDYALICATPEFYSVKGLDRLSQFLTQVGERHRLVVLGVILSFWNARGKSNKPFVDAIEKTFPHKTFKTKIRRDISISEAALYGRPVFESHAQSRAAEDFLAVSLEILNRIDSYDKRD